MYIKREISQNLQKLIRQFPVLIVTGARQTGKTTLLRSLFFNYHYVSLDLPSLAELAEQDPSSFLSQFPKPLLIDEAQYAPKLFRHIKQLVDADRNHMGQFILTGSQKFNLMKEVSDSLAGRCVWLELEGLSATEIFPSALNLSYNEIARLLIRGSLPELWQRLELPAADYYRSYLATYLERDVRQILNVGSLRDFERFIRVCATRSGQLLNKTEMAKDVGISVKTVNDWLSVLEASNQISLLEPYFSNPGKRVIKSPKLFFCEVGLFSFLLGLSEQTLASSPFVGHLWETFIYAELRKQIKNQESGAHVWFYRDQQAREIDFLFLCEGKLHFYECKWTEQPAFKDAVPLNLIYEEIKAQNDFPYQLGPKGVICRTPYAFPMRDGVMAVPFLQMGKRFPSSSV